MPEPNISAFNNRVCAPAVASGLVRLKRWHLWLHSLAANKTRG